MIYNSILLQIWTQMPSLNCKILLFTSTKTYTLATFMRKRWRTMAQWVWDSAILCCGAKRRPENRAKHRHCVERLFPSYIGSIFWFGFGVWFGFLCSFETVQCICLPQETTFGWTTDRYSGLVWHRGKWITGFPFLAALKGLLGKLNQSVDLFFVRPRDLLVKWFECSFEHTAYAKLIQVIGNMYVLFCLLNEFAWGVPLSCWSGWSVNIELLVQIGSMIVHHKFDRWNQMIIPVSLECN